VELDGRTVHRPEDRWADVRRDNFFASVGIVTLRYGRADVTEHPCRIAAEVGQVLGERGWTGTVSRCGPACGC
jgi:very-short-patch-repair endonuclease